MVKKNPAAVALGRLGGKVKSDKKAAAAVRNLEGHRTGRPKGAKDTKPRKKRGKKNG